MMSIHIKRIGLCASQEIRNKPRDIAIYGKKSTKAQAHALGLSCIHWMEQAHAAMEGVVRQ